MSINKNGVVLHEDHDTVVIATGLANKSTNRKTGGMVQVYILYRHESPMAALYSGADAKVCGDCKHRPVLVTNKDGSRRMQRRCYVDLGKGARGVWLCYRRGGYRKAEAHEWAELFTGRTVRIGSYGDPFFMPHWTIPAIKVHAKRWTGYTHQWRKANGLSAYLMASVDSEAEAIEAQRLGWRTFRVARKGDSTKLPGEIVCPASAEGGKRTTCEKCCLCNGKQVNDKRANIVIQDHSVIAKSAPLVQINL